MSDVSSSTARPRGVEPHALAAGSAESKGPIIDGSTPTLEVPLPIVDGDTPTVEMKLPRVDGDTPTLEMELPLDEDALVGDE